MYEIDEKTKNRKYLQLEPANIYEIFVGSESTDIFLENTESIESAVDSYIENSEFFNDLDEETFDYVRKQLIRYLKN